MPSTRFAVFCGGYALGWRRRQVRALTSSKSWMAMVARGLSIAPATRVIRITRSDRAAPDTARMLNQVVNATRA